MAQSPLTQGNLPHHGKCNSRDGTPIGRVVVHHWAGTYGGDSRLADPDAQASANYLIYSDGRLVSQVPEEFRAWTSGGYAVDAPSITVEVQNSTNGPDWLVSDAAVAKLTALVADIASRYGWGRVDRSRVRGHREFAATACPGPYLWPLLPSIAENANNESSQPYGQEEEDLMVEPIYVRDKALGSKGAIYALNPVTGRKRHLPPAEWNAVVKASRVTGVNASIVDIDAADIAGIPNV